ncbi:MAG TPA: HPr family phosphocarrier protein [Desulfobacteraceae bacterium]|nr:HPr family phosphocarrier protein [Desulfobacteraceae bacterium]
MTIIEKDVVVHNHHGIHGRVAAGLAQIAARNKVILQIIHGGEAVDCSSILEVLSMAFVYGTRVTIRIEGEGRKAAKALAAVEKLLTAGREE